VVMVHGIVGRYGHLLGSSWSSFHLAA
jgi:hypothetical protein